MEGLYVLLLIIGGGVLGAAVILALIWLVERAAIGKGLNL